MRLRRHEGPATYALMPRGTGVVTDGTLQPPRQSLVPRVSMVPKAIPSRLGEAPCGEKLHSCDLVVTRILVSGIPNPPNPPGNKEKLRRQWDHCQIKFAAA